MTEPKLTPFDKITIRVISTGQDQKTKFLFHHVANNKGMMKHMGFVISDPQYDAKMEAIRNKKPFSENGQAKEPVKESFSIPIVTTEPKIPQVKNEIVTPVIVDEPKIKRTRRTKAQMQADKSTKKQNA